MDGGVGGGGATSYAVRAAALAGRSAYEVLGVRRDAEEKEVRAAYRGKLRTEHPDKGGDAERFRALQAALAVALDDLQARSAKKYDWRASRKALAGEEGGEAEGADKQEEQLQHRPEAAPEAVSTPDALAEQAKARGNEAFADGDAGTACACWTEALVWSPGDAALYSNRSAGNLRLGWFDDALADAQQALLLRPRWPKAQYRVGLALAALKDFRGAADAFRRCLDLDPGLDAAQKQLDAAEAAVGASAMRGRLGHGDRVYAISHAPAVPGRRPLLATASLDGTARVWCAASGACLATLRDHEGKVTAAVWSDDGRALATASLDRTCRLWDVGVDCVPMCRAVLKGHEGRVVAVAWSPDARSVVTCSTDHTARVWDAASGQCRHECTGHKAAVSSVAMAPHGRMFATSSGDGWFRTWSVTTGLCLDEVEWKDSGGITACKFTPPGQSSSGGSMLVTAHYNPKFDEGRILMWDAERVNMQVPLRAYSREFPHKQIPYKGPINDLDVFETVEGGLLIALALQEGSMTVIDVDADATLYTMNDTHTIRHAHSTQSCVFAVRFSPTGRFVATAGIDGSVQIWDAEDGTHLHTLRSGVEEQVKALSWALDESTLASGGDSGTAILWAPASGSWGGDEEEEEDEGAEGGDV